MVRNIYGYRSFYRRFDDIAAHRIVVNSGDNKYLSTYLFTW